MMLFWRRAATLITTIAVTTPLVAMSTASNATTGPMTEDSRVVRDWERSSIRTIYTEAATPIPIGVLYLGFTSVAMYEAVTTAHRHHASAAAAAAVAAHDVLLEYFPGSAANLDADLAASLADVPDGPAERLGIRLGAVAADVMIKRRAHDGRNDASIVYARSPEPGVWQPAPGGAMLAPWLGFVRPLVVRSPIKVDGPDPIGSAAYAVDYAEVKATGGTTAADRTAYQTETAVFFNSNSAIMVSEALLGHLDRHPLDVRATARMFAVIHGAMTDSVITCFRLKYEVGFWRPVQAVHGAASDSNPATVPDTNWAPLIPNPPYADYVSGHACLTSPAVETIRRTLGEQTPLTLHSYSLGTDRTYPTLSAIEFDAFHARIWGGLHFRDAMEDGYTIGHTAAQRAIKSLR